MSLKELTELAADVQAACTTTNQKDGHQTWTITEYMQGFTGDVDDLAKLNHRLNTES